MRDVYNEIIHEKKINLNKNQKGFGGGFAAGGFGASGFGVAPAATAFGASGFGVAPAATAMSVVTSGKQFDSKLLLDSKFVDAKRKIFRERLDSTVKLCLKHIENRDGGGTVHYAFYRYWLWYILDHSSWS